MGKKFHLQEKLFHFTSVRLGDILENFLDYEGKKSINGISIPLNHSIHIPFAQDRFFYAVRLTPYYNNGTTNFGIPNIELYGKVHEDSGEFVIENKHCTMRALYDGAHPGYRITQFDVSHQYIGAILNNIEIHIQVLQHLEDDPLQEVGELHYDKKYGFGIIKDGTIHQNNITFNKSYYELNIESINLSSFFSTYNRSIIIPVAYPVHKSLLVSSFIPIVNTKEVNIPGVTYDDSFYNKPGVPSLRSFFATLNFSGRIVR